MKPITRPTITSTIKPNHPAFKTLNKHALKFATKPDNMRVSRPPLDPAIKLDRLAIKPAGKRAIKPC